MSEPLLHPQNRPRLDRWCVMVECEGVVGCVGAYRWHRPQFMSRKHRRFWPEPKRVYILWPLEAW